MQTEIYWVQGPWKGRLAIMPRPRGGDWLEDEVRSWQQAGLNCIVSLLTPDEVVDLDLHEESRLARIAGIDFVSFPIKDRDVPASRNKAAELVSSLARRLEQGENVGIHCRQGIGRAALIAASLLIKGGLEPETAFEQLSVSRGCPVPETAEQKRWVKDFAREPSVLKAR